jgi:hypothetical protein
MITPTPFQRTVLDSPARLKLVRGAPRIGKTMLAVLAAVEVSQRGDDTWYRSPFRGSVYKFVYYFSDHYPDYKIERRGNFTVQLGRRIWASRWVPYQQARGFAPDLLILDQVERCDAVNLERYVEGQHQEHRDTLLCYDPQPWFDTDDHDLSWCEWTFVQSLLHPPRPLLQQCFDYSPLLPGGYANPSERGLVDYLFEPPLSGLEETQEMTDSDWRKVMNIKWKGFS